MMEQAQLNLQDRVESYLDGLLDDAETNRFEQDLLREEVATCFRETLLLRELLGALPPDQPPPGLVTRIESALALEAKKNKQEQKAINGRAAGGFWTALKAGLSWPGYALTGLTGGSKGLKSSVGGMQTIGYSLGPLLEPARKGVQSIHLPRKPLWKTALSGLWRGLAS